MFVDQRGRITLFDTPHHLREGENFKVEKGGYTYLIHVNDTATYVGYIIGPNDASLIKQTHLKLCEDNYVIQGMTCSVGTFILKVHRSGCYWYYNTWLLVYREDACEIHVRGSRAEVGP